MNPKRVRLVVLWASQMVDEWPRTVPRPTALGSAMANLPPEAPISILIRCVIGSR